MELKEGYKQTETGLIPEDWGEYKVGDFITFQGGSQPDKSFFSQTYKPGYSRLIQIRDYKSDNFQVFVPTALARRFCEEDDIMIGRYGPPVFQILRGLSGAYNVALIKAIPNQTINGNFAYYFLKQDSLFQFIDRLSRRTSGQTGVDLAELRAYPLPLPPTKSEQEAIAEALSDADALIESLEQLIAKKRQIKQGCMQELLSGNKRLSGFSDEWLPVRLGDLGATYGGLTGKTKVDFGGGTAHYITFLNIMSNVVIDCATFESVMVSATETQNPVKKGDLFFNGSSETPEEIAMCSILLEEVTDVYLNSFCFGFRFKEGVEADKLFFVYFSRSSEGRELMKSLAQGSTRYNLSKIALLNSYIRIPNLSEQTAIAVILSDIDAEITSLETKIAKIRQVKRGMMHGLLTGKTRLPRIT
jgi:type I restriction enzyme, S subunit